MSNNIFDKKIQLSRVLLRRLKIEDVDDMYEYTSNSDVTTYLSWEPHKDKSQVKLFIKEAIDKYESTNLEYTYAIELISEKKLIGTIRVINISYYNKRAEFTLILNPHYQGKGYMSEVFNGLLTYCFKEAGINRIQGLIAVKNIPSQVLFKKSGFRLEGILKDYWVLKGEFTDAQLYAITAEEFFQQ